MDTQVFAQLRDCLAQLYPSDGDVTRVAHDAGINSMRVAIDESAVNRWHALLVEAEKVNAIERLFQIARKEYGEHEPLRALNLTYRQQQPLGALQETGSVELSAKRPLPHPSLLPRRLVGARVLERIAIALFVLCVLLLNVDEVQSAAGRARTIFITMIDSNSGKVITTRTVEAPVFSPDNMRMAMTTQDGAVVLADLITGKEMTKMYYETAVTDLFFTQDGTRLIIIVDGNTIHIWDSQNGEKLSSLHHDAVVTKTAFSANSARLVVTTADGTVQTWNLAPMSDITGAQVPDPIQSNQATTNSTREGIAALETDTVSNATASVRSNNAILSQRRFFGPERAHLLTDELDGSYALWNNVSARLVTYFQNNAALTKLSSSPDSTRLATVEQKSATANLIRLWNSNTGTQLASFSYPMMVTQILFSPDSTYLAVVGDTVELNAGASSVVYIVNSKTGSQVSELRHNTIVNQLIFSSDSNQLATATVEGIVYLWQTHNGSSSLQFNHRTDVIEMRFRADGERLITIAANGAKNDIYLWDTTTGGEVQRFVDVIGLERVSFTENNTQLIVIAESLIRND